jgi:hypothetical protein
MLIRLSFDIWLTKTFDYRKFRSGETTKLQLKNILSTTVDKVHLKLYLIRPFEVENCSDETEHRCVRFNNT